MQRLIPRALLTSLVAVTAVGTAWSLASPAGTAVAATVKPAPAATGAAPTLPATSPKRAATATVKKTAIPKKASKTASVASRFSVTGTAGKGVAVRSAPGKAAKSIGRKAEGATLTISCQVKGETVRDATSGHVSSLWDKLSSGGYVANIYTTAYEAKTTGYSKGLHRCTGTTPTIPKTSSSTTKPVAASGASTATTAPATPASPSAAPAVVGAKLLATTTIA